MSKKVDEFWALLEAERIDSSWRKREPKYQFQPPEPVVKVKKVEVPLSVKSQKKRDRIFFQLGRFEAGVRDQDALWGKIEADKLWGKEAKS